MTKPFARFASKAGIESADLKDAIGRAERGSIDADLGGGVIKQRIARRGEGKSGGFRTIVLFRIGDRAVFVYGFAKSERDNIDPTELKAFKLLASRALAFGETEIAAILKSGAWIEVR